jgi:hypothetical protein
VIDGVTKEIEVIAYDKFPLPLPAADSAMAPHAKRKLQEIADGEHTLDQTDLGLVYGNMPGISLLRDKWDVREQCSRLDDGNKSLRSEVSALRNQAKAHEERTKTLEEQMSQLRSQCHHMHTEVQHAVEGFLTIRGRFLANYRRSLPGDFQDPRGVVHQGNKIAHDCNALSDAMVYERGHRTDVNLYEQLYGLSPQALRKISESFVLLVLFLG